MNEIRPIYKLFNSNREKKIKYTHLERKIERKISEKEVFQPNMRNRNKIQDK